MSQGVLSTPNGSGLLVRTGFNAAIARLATKASGTSRPSDIAQYEEWIETDNPGSGIGTLWLWDGTTDIFLGLVNTTTHAFVPASVLTTQGDILYRGASADARLAAAADAFKSLFSGGAGANPAWAGTWKVLGEVQAAGSASASFTGIPSAINHLRILGEWGVSTDGAQLVGRTYDAGGVLDTGGSDYQAWWLSYATDNSSGVSSSGATNGIVFTPGGVDTSNDWGGAIDIVAMNIQRASPTKFSWSGQYLNTTGGPAVSIHGAGVRQESDRITGVQLFPSAGNFTGRFTLLGMA